AAKDPKCERPIATNCDCGWPRKLSSTITFTFEDFANAVELRPLLAHTSACGLISFQKIAPHGKPRCCASLHLLTRGYKSLVGLVCRGRLNRIVRRPNVYVEAACCRTASVSLLSSSSGRTARRFLALSSEWYARTASNGLISPSATARIKRTMSSWLSAKLIFRPNSATPAPYFSASYTTSNFSRAFPPP